MSNLAPSPLRSHAKVFSLLVLLLLPTASKAETDSNRVQELRAEVDQLKELVTDLQARVTLLEGRSAQLRASSSGGPDDAVALSRAALSLRRNAAAAPPLDVPPQQVTPAPSSASQLPTTLPGGATLNYYVDGYFANNFNNPVGRVNDLRAYDVLSRTFSINQADVIFERDPDLDAHRRYGLRIDLQFGQATETLQGNPSVEPSA